MVQQIIIRESIVTTISKAKFMQPEIDKIITRALKDDVIARRHIAKIVGNDEVFKKLFSDIIGRYSTRTSGFTTRKLLGRRRGDNSLMVRIELSEADVKAETASTTRNEKTKLVEKKSDVEKTVAKTAKIDSKKTKKVAAAKNPTVKKNSDSTTKNKTTKK